DDESQQRHVVAHLGLHAPGIEAETAIGEVIFTERGLYRLETPARTPQGVLNAFATERTDGPCGISEKRHSISDNRRPRIVGCKWPSGNCAAHLRVDQAAPDGRIRSDYSRQELTELLAFGSVGLKRHSNANIRGVRTCREQPAIARKARGIDKQVGLIREALYTFKIRSNSHDDVAP